MNGWMNGIKKIHKSLSKVNSSLGERNYVKNQQLLKGLSAGKVACQVKEFAAKPDN